jgi:hypothetical protein
MSDEQRNHDRLSLDEIRRLTAVIAQEEDPSLEVVAATTAEGEHSSEVVLARKNAPGAEPVVVRVDRFGSESELRPIVRERLRAAARSTGQQTGTTADADATNRIDELSTDLDDLRVVADEIQEQPPAGVTPGTVERLKRALSEATDAADDIENEIK